MSRAYHQGRVLYELKRYEEAILMLQRAYSEEPSNIDVHILTAWSYYLTKRAEIGLRATLYALALDPENERALIIHSACASYIGQQSLANKSLNIALTLNPGNAHAHYHRSFQFVKQRKYRLALDSIEQALFFDPCNHTYTAFRSHILSVLGKNVEAKTAALESLRLNPEAAAGHLQFGKAQRKEGNIDGSLESLSEALRNDPNNEEARKELVESLRCAFPPYRWTIELDHKLISLPYWKKAFFWLSPVVIGIVGILLSWQFMVLGRSQWINACFVVMVVYLLPFLSLFALKYMSYLFLDGMVAFNPKYRFAIPKAKRLLAKSSLVMLCGGAIAATIGIVIKIQVVALWGIFCFVGSYGLSYYYSLEERRF